MSGEFDPYHKWLGIPPAEQPPNYYRLLGVTLFESDPDVIAYAAEQRIVHLRAFQIGKHADHSQHILGEIASARVCLLNPDRKAAYDAQLRSTAATSVARPVVAAPIPISRAPISAAAPPLASFTGSSGYAKHAARRLKRVWPLALGVLLAVVLMVALALQSGNRDETVQSITDRPTDMLAPPKTPDVAADLPGGEAESRESGDMPQEDDAPVETRASMPSALPTSEANAAIHSQDNASVDGTPTYETPSETLEKDPAPRSEEPISAANAQSTANSDATVNAESSTNAPLTQQPPTSMAENESVAPVAAAAEDLEQAAQRLETELAHASDTVQQRRIAQDALALADRAIVGSQLELATRMAKLGLRAARPAQATELVNEATLRIIRLAAGISDDLKEQAKQRLREQ